jgi:clan AA aspartic protease
MMANEAAMGTFKIPVRFSNPRDESRFAVLDALVDTGATDCGVPASLLKRLGVQPYREKEYEVAGGEIAVYPLGEVVVQVNGERATVPVTFDPENATPTLGAIALEALGFAPDPIARRLLPVRRFKK